MDSPRAMRKRNKGLDPPSYSRLDRGPRSRTDYPSICRSRSRLLFLGGLHGITGHTVWPVISAAADQLLEPGKPAFPVWRALRFLRLCARWISRGFGRDELEMVANLQTLSAQHKRRNPSNQMIHSPIIS